MRFRHVVNAWNDWATGDAGMPDTPEAEEEEEEEEEHDTLVSVSFGGAHCTLSFVNVQVTKMLCSETSSKSAVCISRNQDEGF